ncbi:2-C-methyl-D-erythritol 4-phosphate cytidylyltransferase [Nocardioides sp. cx-169]|uniref:2-C-methyl-D-erythritol 4-phosphate cytidylyltransferase n=1 Tax=Nocardioides sp. cx-169 TaxID=2899080 RepID=UPI001E395742|nr:2-C-methyl-D-erythritol 4-phosphate cytidylyltransferase [Nocardioides sp. cx-169]MCD4533809.1 2-C-methyl-D-erythritol 4-phosphate cytidylyltransferase [Nocardioides sp. cx-169]
MSTPVARPDHAVLPLVGRGDVPFALLHRRPLHVHAVRALVELGSHAISVLVEPHQRERVRHEVSRAAPMARVLEVDEWWKEVVAAPTGLLVHDPLCPLASAGFLASVADEAARTGISAVAFRPVTDTVKTVVEDRIQGTIDREGLAGLIAPAVVAQGVVESADGPPPLGDFGELVAWMRARGDVSLVKGPSLARRVDDTSAVNLLECVDELRRQVRAEDHAPLSDG